MATAAPPLRRETAERLVGDLVHRAHLVNADDNWSYRVRILVVFGSYTRGVERPNDVDIACQLGPRWSGEKQQRKEQESRERRGGRFRNISEWATWPKLEVIRYLRARARGLSIHELEDWIKATEHTVIFEDVSAFGAWKIQGRMPASNTGYAEFLWLNPGFHHDQIPKIQHVNRSVLIPVSSSGLGAALSSRLWRAARWPIYSRWVWGPRPERCELRSTTCFPKL